MTLKEVALVSGISYTKVLSEIEEGKLRAIKINGKKYVTYSDFREWIYKVYKEGKEGVLSPEEALGLIPFLGIGKRAEKRMEKYGFYFYI